MKIQFSALMGILLLCACGSNSNQTEKQDMVRNGDIVTVSDSASVAKKIKVETVEAKTYQPQFTTSGMVKAIPNLYAEISTPFAGRIVRSFVQLGQTVGKGSALFELSSPDFFETGKAYFAAKQEMEQALKSLKRQKDLLANRVGVKREVEEAEVTYQLKRQEYENACSALKVFQVNPSQVRLGEPLVVRSPVAGKVIKNELVIGQYIKEDAEPMVVVADLRKVWVVAHVKEKDIHLIDSLQQVDIRLSALPNEPLVGTIKHVSEVLDEATRSVEVIIECTNTSGKIKPQMYATIVLSDTPRKALLVPTSAILQDEGKSYVYVALGGNRYKKTSVTTGDVVKDKSVIASGLTAGDKVIAEGAFYLLDAK